MKNRSFTLFAAALLIPGFVFISCKKDKDNPIPDNGGGQSSALKEAAAFPVGVGIDYTYMKNDAAYASIVKTEFDNVTFGYNMKHGAIVKDDGTFNYTAADELVNICTAAGLQIFGHTLVWHQNQNAGYLKNYAKTSVQSQTNLLTNPGFESGLTDWSQFNAQNGATMTATSVSSEIHSGSSALKVVNPVANNAGQWKVQEAGPLMNLTAGKQYLVSYYVKAAAEGGSIRLSTQDQNASNALYQSDQTIGTSWQQVSWIITANASQMRILFDMGLVANTYYIDDVSVGELVTSTNMTEIAQRLDTAMNKFISSIVTRYKGKVFAWDVVNEAFADNGALRNNSNTNTSGTDTFVWSNYMGKDFALKAFNYAKAADPDAFLFINDYGLESNPVKTDSLVAYAKYLVNKGAKVDGIGTQMHISINTTYSGIDQMFTKLAASGLKVRVSELDCRINPGDLPAFTPTPALFAQQAAVMKYVVESYIRNVPLAQRYGLTVWGVSDADSWIVGSQKKVDNPNVWDNTFQKKPAHDALVQGLKGL
jgi:endo-1,4-beta-xylanase